MNFKYFIDSIFMRSIWPQLTPYFSFTKESAFTE